VSDPSSASASASSPSASVSSRSGSSPAGSAVVTGLVLDRDVLAARGPESETYLQGQLSQDVAALEPGSSTWSWLLAPNGKVDALLRVTRAGADEWLLDTDAGWGPPVQARLERFKLRTKVEFGPSERRVVALRGIGWDQIAVDSETLVVAPPWPGVEGADLIGTGALPSGVEPLDPAGYDALRVEAGIPKLGAELDERTIPGETGLVPFTVSFTKGCYTGQELVARIDSRGGHVPRRLRGLRFDDGATVTPGDSLLGSDGETATGIVTSVARSGTGTWIGLGYIRRGTEVSDVLTINGSGGRVRQVELAP